MVLSIRLHLFKICVAQREKRRTSRIFHDTPLSGSNLAPDIKRKMSNPNLTIMKPNGFLLLLLITLTVFTSCSKTELVEEETLYETTALASMSTLEEDLFNIVNTHRAEMGLNKLEFSDEALKYAFEHNQYMIEQDKLSHDFFSSRASNIANETNAVYVGENVAKDYNTNLGAFQGWYNSPPHRKTMEGDFTHAAVSIVISPRGKPFFTQIFYRK